MLRFIRLKPGIYISECKNFAIKCESYPPAWAVYVLDGRTYERRTSCSLLCLAKSAAARIAAGRSA